MAQLEQNWTLKSTKQSEDKHTKNIKETIRRQRQLTSQAIEEIEQIWEETQRDRNEIYFLKKTTEQQQEDIGRLTAEKHEQHILIKQLRVQLESVIDKLKENKNEDTQEKIQLQKMHVDIHHKSETLKKMFWDYEWATQGGNDQD